MLYKSTVESRTFELLKRLMSDEMFQNFHLAGGTALALHIGHRKSIDLDMFTCDDFDFEILTGHLKENYEFEDSFFEKNTLKGFAEGIKIDFLTHNYPLADAVTVEENIRLYSVKDIAAMKLNAIAGNGTRLKDFIDIAYLSSVISLAEMLDAYTEKYRSSYVPALKGLLYFDDINFNDPVQMINGTLQWKVIIKRLEMMHQYPEHVFPKPVS